MASSQWSTAGRRHSRHHSRERACDGAACTVQRNHAALATRRESGEDRPVRRDPEPGSPGMNRSFEAAVSAGQDPARYAHLLRQIRDAALSCGRAPAARPIANDSWRRTLERGMDPDRGRELPTTVGPDEVESRRHTGAHRRTPAHTAGTGAHRRHRRTRTGAPCSAMSCWQPKTLDT